MGNRCPCGKYVLITDLSFELENSKENHSKKIKIKFFRGEDQDERVFEDNIEEEKEGINDFIKLINKIIINKNKFSQQKIKIIGADLKKIAEDIDKKNIANKKISNIISIFSGKEITVEIIDGFIFFCKYIYNNRKKINKNYFKNLISSLKYTLKSDNILKRNEYYEFLQFFFFFFYKNTYE